MAAWAEQVPDEEHLQPYLDAFRGGKVSAQKAAEFLVGAYKARKKFEASWKRSSGAVWGDDSDDAPEKPKRHKRKPETSDDSSEQAKKKKKSKKERKDKKRKASSSSGSSSSEDVKTKKKEKGGKKDDKKKKRKASSSEEEAKTQDGRKEDRQEEKGEGAQFRGVPADEVGRCPGAATSHEGGSFEGGKAAASEQQGASEKGGLGSRLHVVAPGRCGLVLGGCDQAHRQHGWARRRAV